MLKNLGEAQPQSKFSNLIQAKYIRTHEKENGTVKVNAAIRKKKINFEKCYLIYELFSLFKYILYVTLSHI